jgi:hypothetical protein
MRLSPLLSVCILLSGCIANQEDAKPATPVTTTPTTLADNAADIKTPSTTAPTTTTAPASMIVSTTTESSLLTTTTLFEIGKRCQSADDCGGTVSVPKCAENILWNVTTVYKCIDGGTDASYCLGKQNAEIAQKCELYEKCMNGSCAGIYENECDFLCHLNEYDSYYCNNGRCLEGDTYTSLKKGPCNENARTCCCKND